MALVAFNLTATPDLPLAAGNPAPPTLDAGAPPEPGPPLDVSSELQPSLTVDPINGVAGGLEAADFAALEVQRAAGDIDFQWDGPPEFKTGTLKVGGQPLPADQTASLDAATPALTADNPPLSTAVASFERFVKGTTGNDSDDGKTDGTAFQSGQKGIDDIPFQLLESSKVILAEDLNNQGTIFIEKDVAEDKVLLIDGGLERVPMSALSGKGDSIAISGVFPAITVTLTDAAANFTSNLVGKKVWLRGVTNWFNALNGPFTITAVPGPTQIQWMALNPFVSAEPAFAGRWYLTPYDAPEDGDAGGAFTFAAGNVTMDVTGGDFTEADVGKKITTAGSTSPGNDGPFVIATVNSPTQIVFANAAGVTEPFAGTWTLGGYVADKASAAHIGLASSAWFRDQFRGLQLEPMTGLTAELRTVQDVDEAESGAAALNGTGDDFDVDDIDGFKYDAADNTVILTDYAADFTKDRLGNEVDLVGKNVVVAGATSAGNNGTFAIVAVLNKHQIVYVNATPGVTEAGAGTWTIGVSTTMTLTDAAGAWREEHVGKNITIAGSTSAGNDGTFAVTKVLSPTQVQYVNAAGVTEAVAGTWAMQRDLTVAAGVVTLVDCAAEFSPRLVGKEITLAGSTSPANDVTAVVTEWVSSIEVKFANASGVTEAFPGTWTTEQGWVTPIRNFSAIPTGAEFRFVRPKTKLSGNTILVVSNLGLGEIAAQGIYTEDQAEIRVEKNSGLVRLADLVLGANLSGTALRIRYGGAAYVRAERRDPTSFALLDAATDPHVGVSSLGGGGSSVVNFQVSGMQEFVIAGAIFTGVSFFNRCQSIEFLDGALFSNCVIFGSNQPQPGGMANSLPGWAPVKFGGGGVNGFFQIAPLSCAYSGGMHFGDGVIFEDTFGNALEANAGSVFFSYNVKSAKIPGFGLYIHTGSTGQVQNGLGIFPSPNVNLNGKKGPISSDNATILGRWSEVIASNLLSDPERAVAIARRFQFY
jgi:hypothetical protein